MSTQTKPKIIACISSDPGGAQAVTAAASVLTKRLGMRACFATEPAGFRSPGNQYASLGSTEEVRSWLSQAGAQLLLTGTSTRSELELKGVQTARELGIPSLSLVDHWTAIKSRFERSTILSGCPLYPDRIGVIDAIAWNTAIEQGIPSDKLVIVGQPHWKLACSYRPHQSRDDFLKKWKLPLDRPYFVFLSDSLIEEAQGDKDASKKRWGYLETEVAEQVLESIPSGAHCVIQLHPKETAEKYSMLSMSKPDVTITRVPDVFELIHHSSGCIGMFTAVLAQAYFMGVPVCRFEPGLSPSSSANHLPIAEIPRFFDQSDLKNEIAKWTSGASNPRSGCGKADTLASNHNDALIQAIQALLT